VKKVARPLKIPIFLQPVTKPYCGPTCMKMILGFYGIKISLNKLVKQLPMTESGIDLCSMGLFLRNFGFVATFLDGNSKSSGHVFYKSATPLFVKGGGSLINRAIRISDVKEAIAMGCPVILNIESSHNPGSGHYVVVKHVGKKRMTINDPNCGQKVLSIKKLMSACRNWSGGAIIVIPNQIISNHLAG
jgi:ABC-type bacteriocin/lantibiotic exporter with double-glycine peptidase domain